MTSSMILRSHKYRSHMEIICALLEVAKKPTGKTKLMMKTCVSFTQLKDFLDKTQGLGVLEYDEVTRTFNTTEKGLKFLQLNQELSHIINEYEK